MQQILHITRSLWHLARPAGAWAAPTLPLLGYGWAHWDRALLAWNAHALPLVMLAWLALQTGTLWLNAARDRDDGEVLFGRSVKVPKQAAIAGIVGLAVAVIVAFIAHPIAGLCALGAAALSVLYSHPRFAWKAHPIGGPAVNVIGYGILSPAAGYALAETPITVRTLPIAIALALTTLGWFYAAQAFQQSEDQRRGDRTVVATHGPRAVLRITRICQASVGILVLALCVAGWIPRLALISLPLFVWLDVYLARWMAQPSGGTESWARGLALRSIVLLAALMALIFVDYTQASIANLPVAGLGTDAGHPHDRRALPPSQQQLHDLRSRAKSGLPYTPVQVDHSAPPP